MPEQIVVVLIAASASVVGSLLTFVVGIRAVRRAVSTSNGIPLGKLLELRLDRLEARLDRIETCLGLLRERLAFQEGQRRKLL